MIPLLDYWKPILGFEGHYDISVTGNIYSHSKRSLKKPTLNNGYLRVSLWKNGKDTVRYVHQIVAENFNGSCPVGEEVNHSNGWKINNWASNLEYMTTQKNTAHAVETGLMQKGERDGHAKLTESDVLDIRAMHGKLGYIRIGRIYGLDHTTIRNIVKRKSWKHLA